MDSDEAMQAYLMALNEERALWAQIRGMLPGEPGYNAELWNQWSEAADRAHAASKALVAAYEQARSRRD